MQDPRHLRRIILRKLYSHLRKRYCISVSMTPPLEGQQSLHYVDALLAFKTDDQLDRLRGALGRLEEGVFGFCLKCQKEIDEEHLEADPTRQICEQCELVSSHRVARFHDVPISE